MAMMKRPKWSAKVDLSEWRLPAIDQIAAAAKKSAQEAIEFAVKEGVQIEIEKNGMLSVNIQLGSGIDSTVRLEARLRDAVKELIYLDKSDGLHAEYREDLASLATEFKALADMIDKYLRRGA